MTLKIIGAAPGRTGTVSLMTALEHLGYGPCHHMKACIENAQQTKWFLEAANGLPVDWHEVFEHYQAAVDWPASAYYKTLLETFPEARVIFSDRPAEAWYDGVASTIYQVVPSLPGWLRKLVPHLDRWGQMVEKTIWQNELSGRFQDRRFAVQFFKDRLAEVREVVPPEQLLVHSAKEGWEPLCHFLNVKVPSIPYPRANEATRIQRAVKVLKAANYFPHAILIALVISAIALTAA